MSYPLPFLRLVLGGKNFTEDWNTSLSIVADGNGAVSDASLVAMAALVGSWFTSTGTNGPSFLSHVTLQYIKFNRINVDGHYMDPVAKTHVYPTALVGPTGLIAAPQLTAVVTLTTAFERGLANRGRMYLPPSSGFDKPASDGLVTTANALRLSNAVATLINSINNLMSPQSGSPRVAIVSNVRSGAWHSVTGAKTGRVIDTMRSRRASLAEDYQKNTTGITL